MTLYFPPAGGGGVQRPLKFATHLPALGIETARARAGRPEVGPPRRRPRSADAGLGPPRPLRRAEGTAAGRGAARPAGLERAGRQAALASGGVLVPDENVSWNLTAIPAAIRIARRRGDRRRDHDLAAGLGAPRRRRGQARRRARAGSPTCATRSSPTRTATRRVPARAREGAATGQTRRAAGRRAAPTRSSRSSDAIAEEMRALGAEPGRDDRERLRLRRLRRARVPTPGRAAFRLTHTGSFFGRRDPRPFLDGARRSRRRHRRPLRRRLPRRRPRVGGGARPRRPARAASRISRGGASLELQRDSEALLLLIPESGGRGRGRALGEGVRVPRGRAADPRRRAAGRRRRRADPRDGRRRRRRAGRRRRARATRSSGSRATGARAS